MTISLPQVLAAMVNFFVLLALLRIFLYKPVFNMLDERKNEINQNMTAAENARSDAEQLRAEYESSLKEANIKAQQIIKDAQALGDQTREDIIQKAKDEAARAGQKALEEIAREKQQALIDLRHEVVNLTIDAAEKVVGREVTEADHEKMVNEFITEAGDAK